MKTRLSNVELLRIVAMLLVFVRHVGSCCLMFAFLRFEFSNRLVNWVAMSMLGAYCFHRHPLFKQTAHEVYDSCSGLMAVVMIVGMVLGFFVVGILIDQCRILLWRIVSDTMFSRRGEVSRQE